MISNRVSTANLDVLQKKYTASDPISRFANQTFFATALSLFSQIEGKDVLDAGCGEAEVLQRFAALNKGPCYFGLDIDPARVRLAQESGTDFFLAVGNVEDLPFANDSFDALVMLEVLEHVGNPQRALQEAHRITRRYLLTSVPKEPWWRIGNMARLKYLSQWGNTPEHINHWTSIGFQRFISQLFDICLVRKPLVWTFILADKK